MSIKDNYIKLSKKFGGTHALINKGLSKSIVNSIMNGNDIRLSSAYEVAMVLGVTIEELLTGEPSIETVNEAHEEYQTDEERRYIDKLLAILHGHDEAKKIAVKVLLDAVKQDTWSESERQNFLKKTAQ